MLGFVLVLGLLLAQAAASLYGLASSTRARFAAGLVSAAVALAAIALAALPLPHLSIIVGGAALAGGVAVIAIVWRRSATLSPASREVEQAKAVLPAFVLLGVIGALHVAIIVLAAVFAELG